MAFQCQLGSSAWDAVNFVRNITEDTVAPFYVPDSAYTAHAEIVAEEFSRLLPLESQIGQPWLNTSTFVTVVNQQRYLCNSANGFALVPTRITDVLYRAGGPFTAANEFSYLAILPFSPVNKFLFTPNLLDQPTARYMRDMYLNELDHYGKGFAGVGRDAASGNYFIDLYPVPTGGAVPIFVRYHSQHANTGTGGNYLYASVPEDLKIQFAKLLWAQVLDQEWERLVKDKTAKGGLLELQGDPIIARARAVEIRHEVYQVLGAEAGYALRTG